MTIKLITSFVLAFLFASAFGKYYVPWLRQQKAGQQIKSQVDWHKSKAGTPTMGGVMFIFGAILVCLTVGAEGMLHGRFEHIFVLLFACVFGLIGFLDDWEKLKKKENMGLSSRSKAFATLNGKNTTILQHIRIVKQINVVVPLAHAIDPVIHVVDKIDVKRVPLAILPVTHTIFRLHPTHKVVVTIRNNFGGISAIRQLHHHLAMLVIDLAIVVEHQHAPLLKWLEWTARLIVRA